MALPEITYPYQDSFVRSLSCIRGNTCRRILARVAETRAERKAIFKLRYDIYRAEGAIPENTKRELQDEFDIVGNPILLGLYQADYLIGSVRLHLIDATQSISPAKSVFPLEIANHFSKGIKILDPNRLCLVRGDMNERKMRLMSLLRIPFMAAQYFDVDFVTATSRPKHMNLYRRIFGGALIANPRAYPTMLLPHGLMISNFRKHKHKTLNNLPVFDSTHAERSTVFSITSGHHH